MPRTRSKKSSLNEQAIAALSRWSRLKKYIHHPALWRHNEKAMARGVAIGLFIGVITLLPFQMLIAALLAIVARANLPIAITMTWICNPLTIVPISYLNYSIGNWILGEKSKAMTWQFYQYSDLWTSFSSSFLHFGKAFFTGLPVVATVSALLGYLVVIILWRVKK